VLSWGDDRRGSVLIEFVLVLPIFILILYASASVWKVVAVKDSLASATYQAARYLSVRGYWDRWLRPGDNCQPFPGKWEEEAARIVEQELLHNNPFASLVFTDTVRVYVTKTTVTLGAGLPDLSRWWGQRSPGHQQEIHQGLALCRQGRFGDGGAADSLPAGWRVTAHPQRAAFQFHGVWAFVT